MALRNNRTGEYLKIDFGYLPRPTVKTFKNEEQRAEFNVDATYIQTKSVAFPCYKEFAELQTDASLVDAGKSLIDNYKSIAYLALKNKLNEKEQIWEDY